MIPRFSGFLLAFLTVVAASRFPGADLDKLNKLGTVAPYHRAPRTLGIKERLPHDCMVDKVMYLSRHGSRNPGYEGEFVSAMATAVSRAQDAIANVKLPKKLEFLKGYISELEAESLLEMGRQQMIHHGKEFRKNYPHLKFDSFVTSASDRVIESAEYFGKGYFGQFWNNVSFISPIPVNGVTPSRITPYAVCPNFSFDHSHQDQSQWQSVFVPPITQRLNSQAPGLNFTDKDTIGGFFACAFDYAAHVVSPWCDAFSMKEIEQFEYYIDLNSSGSWGFRLPGDLARVMGSIYVKTLIERFSEKKGKKAYTEFGHDATISLAMTALGLAKDDPPVSNREMTPNRVYRSSNQIPFGAQMVFEMFSCSRSFKGPQIRLVLNEATYPLNTCARSRDDRNYGTCSFASFVESNEFSLGIQHGDAQWASTCGLTA